MSPRHLRWIPLALLVLLAPGCSSPRQVAGAAILFASIAATGAAIAAVDGQEAPAPGEDPERDPRMVALGAGGTGMLLGLAMMLPEPRRPAAASSAPTPGPAATGRAPASVSSAPRPAACPPARVCLPAME